MDAKDRPPHFIPALIAAAMLFIALASLPYGYYQLLRLVVCGAAVYVAVTAYNCKCTWAIWTFAVIALLFNPVAIVHFDREMWKVIDAVVGLIFLSAAFLILPLRKN